MHFVWFADPRYEIDERYERAVRFFGPPDFVHRWWDRRAWQEIELGDVVVFAKGTERDAFTPFSFNDSERL